VLAAVARRPVRFGDRCDYTGCPELLGDLARAVDCGATGEFAGNTARSGDAPSGRRRTAWRSCARGGEATASLIGDPPHLPATQGTHVDA
jgi:hypothetical protein